MKVLQAPVWSPLATIAAPAAHMGSGRVGGWADITSRVGAVMNGGSAVRGVSDSGARQMSEMIKLQMDLCHYQVKVEFVSKIAESGVATVRKLQQTQ